MGRRRREEPRAPVPPAKFIEVWQASKSIKEVSQRLHMSKPACRTRAWRYRNDWNIPLRVFGPEPPPETTDWEKMADYAEKLLQGESEALEEAKCACIVARSARARLQGEPEALEKAKEAAGWFEVDEDPAPCEGEREAWEARQRGAARLEHVCELCKNGQPGVHNAFCRHFVRGYSFLRCDRCNGVVEPSNPTYSERLHYCTACLATRGAAQ